MPPQINPRLGRLTSSAYNATLPSNRKIYGVPLMALEKEWYDRTEAIRTAILQLRDSL